MELTAPRSSHASIVERGPEHSGQTQIGWDSLCRLLRYGGQELHRLISFKHPLSDVQHHLKGAGLTSSRHRKGQRAVTYCNLERRRRRQCCPECPSQCCNRVDTVADLAGYVRPTFCLRGYQNRLDMVGDIGGDRGVGLASTGAASRWRSSLSDIAPDCHRFSRSCVGGVGASVVG